MHNVHTHGNIQSGIERLVVCFALRSLSICMFFLVCAALRRNQWRVKPSFQLLASTYTLLTSNVHSNSTHVIDLHCSTSHCIAHILHVCSVLCFVLQHYPYGTHRSAQIRKANMKNACRTYDSSGTLFVCVFLPHSIEWVRERETECKN